MTGHNPTDRSKLGKAKRHILTDKKGIPLLVVIPSASTHDIKLVTNVVDNVVIKRPSSYKTKKTVRERRRRKIQHLCLDKAYNSKPEEQELINRGYVLHIPPKREKEMKQIKKNMRRSRVYHKVAQIGKNILQKDGLREKTNSWHNRFRKLLTRYEKKVENYLGSVQLSCCMIIYRKIILG
jgi:transposase